MDSKLRNRFKNNWLFGPMQLDAIVQLAIQRFIFGMMMKSEILRSVAFYMSNISVIKLLSLHQNYL